MNTLDFDEKGSIYWHRLYCKYPVQKQAVRWLPKGFLEINF
jgi:hypothetical protein